jgi:hypothetical protein
LGSGLKRGTSVPYRSFKVKEGHRVPICEEREPLEGFRLLLKYENGEEKVFDVSPYLGIGKFSELRNPSLVSSVTIKFDSIEWANHLDLDPEFLYEKSIDANA